MFLERIRPGLDRSKSGLNHLDQFWQSPIIPTFVCALNRIIVFRVVYLFGILGWYQLVFSWYFTNWYQRKTLLVHFGIKKLAGALFSLHKGGLWTPFGALSPPFEGKRVSRIFFMFPGTSKSVPAKSYITKNPNRIYQPTSASTIPIPARKPVLGW